MGRASPLIFLKMSIQSLRRHPVRSGLALLGIVIGIAAMTVTMALGEGANERLKKEILAMGENWISITPGNMIARGEIRRTRNREKTLLYEDYLAIRAFSPYIQACTACVEKKELVKVQGNQLLAEIQGFNADYFRIEPRGLQIGMPFSSYHEEASLPVAVLGSAVAKELFKKDSPIGRIVQIGNYPFKVIGVFNEAPKRMNRLHNPNLNIVIPFSTARKKIVTDEDSRSIHRIILRPKTELNSTQIVAGLRRLLRFRHQIVQDKPDDFTIWDLQGMMEAANKSSQLFNQFLLIAASVSLIVGGIGIMNIMLVAMTERRKEIGIKMALGATSRQILAQFLFESVLLCLAGGAAGIFCGIGAAYIAGLFTEFDWVIHAAPLCMALVTTVFVGLFFGFYPAYKASQLNPVEALQSN